MSYYNSAALLGGMSMEDALEELGGWTFDPNTVNQQQVEASLGADPAVQAAVADITAKYNIPPNLLKAMLSAIFVYDSYLMIGRPQTAKGIKDQLLAQYQPQHHDAVKAIWRYLRRKIHTYGSHPQKFTQAQRRAMKDDAAAARQRRMIALQASPWVGSDPYTGTGHSTRGNYRYLSSGMMTADELRRAKMQMEGAKRLIGFYKRPRASAAQ